MKVPRVSGAACVWAVAVSLYPLAAPADSRVLETPVFRGVVFPETAPEMALGVAVSGIGDFNGDGIGDFALGDAPPFIQKPSQVFLILGREEYPEVFDVWTESRVIRIRTGSATFGSHIAPAGDVDGDGLADVWIHQPARSRMGPEVDPYLYLLYGARSLPSVVEAEAIGFSVRGAVFKGRSLPTLAGKNPLVSVRDFNGDGYRDLVLGQPVAVGPLEERGMVTVLFGVPGIEGPWDMDEIVAGRGGVRVRGTTLSDDLEGFGKLVAAAGDVNGDGFEDVVVGEPVYNDETYDRRSRFHLIYGARGFPPEVLVERLGPRRVTIEIDKHLVGSMRAVFGGGDLDGDAYPEFGCSFLESLELGSKGYLFIVRGGPGLPERAPISSLISSGRACRVEVEDPLYSRGLGEEVLLAPDEDGDSRPELFVVQVWGSGRAFVIPGAFPLSSGAFERPLHEFRGALYPPEGHQAGFTVGSAGDVNGDGVPDYLIGRPDSWGDPTDRAESRVYLVFGGFETKAFAIRGAEPLRAPVQRSVDVIVSGSGFVPGVQVFFGPYPAREVEVLDPHTVRVKTPVVRDSAVTARLRVVHPDSREAVLPEEFSFYGTRELSLGQLQDFAILRPSSLCRSCRIEPEVLGDLDGDGKEEYALRVSVASMANLERGVCYVLRGGTVFRGSVTEERILEEAALVLRVGPFAPTAAAAGDLDRDGKGELLVAKPYAVSRGFSEFAVIFSPLDFSQKDVELADLAGHPQAAYFSTSLPLDSKVWNVGDFDGDGSDDLIVRIVGGSYPGSVLLVLGPIVPGMILSPDTAPPGRIYVIWDSRDPNLFGVAAAPAGDFNGDGFSDVALALPGGGYKAIGVLLGHAPLGGSVQLLDLEQAQLVYKFACVDSGLGSFELGPIGDLNEDGFSDLLAYGWYPADVNRGAVAVLLGGKEAPGPNPWAPEAGTPRGFLLRGQEPLGCFGHSASLRGDLDGNGDLDLVVGSFRLTEASGGAKPGLVTILHDVEDLRGEWNIDNVPRSLTRVEGAWPMDRFGSTVRVLGDQDGDGLPELLVEAENVELFSRNRGLLYFLPGRSLFASPEFIRGDADMDRTINISDPIYLLSFLFLGGPDPACADAADGNDDGALNLTDGVYVLTYLFLGGPPPPPPYPEPGTDPTEDALGCSSGVRGAP